MIGINVGVCWGVCIIIFVNFFVVIIGILVVNLGYLCIVIIVVGLVMFRISLMCFFGVCVLMGI